MRCNSELLLKRPPAPQHYVFHQFTCRSKTPNYPLTPRCLSPRAVYSEPDPIFCYPLAPQILILCLLKLMVCYHPNPPSPDLCSECFLHCLCQHYPEVSASPAVTLTGDTSFFHRARGGWVSPSPHSAASRLLFFSPPNPPLRNRPSQGQYCSSFQSWIT